MGLDDYQLLAPLSANEFSLRYEARTHEGELVDVRIVRDELPESISKQALWKRIRLTQMLEHPAIQRVIRADETSRPAFVVLDRLTDESLKQSTNGKSVHVAANV